MPEIPPILSALDQGDPHAAAQLLPQVYDDLRRLAAQKLAGEKPGQTLDPTALVHDAYLRLVGGEKAPAGDSHGHFFAAAAEAMRRILVESARRKQRTKHGGDRDRVEFEAFQLPTRMDADELLALDEALDEFRRHDPVKAQLITL